MSHHSPPRRSSFGNLLRRSKSGEFRSGSQGARKVSQPREPAPAPVPVSLPKSPPRLPVLYNGSQHQPFETFGGDLRSDSVALVSGTADHSLDPYQSRISLDPGRLSMSPSIAIPPVPPNSNGAWADPYARAESMTNRGRYSYASSAISTVNSPRRVRRRKDPTPFNILIIGTRGSGKTSFLEFLKTSLALPAKKRSQRSAEIEQEVTSRATRSGNFIPHYLESDIDGERVGLTLWDSEGLEKNVVDLQLREMSSFLEGKFEETFAEEMKVIRSPGVQDTHIHAVFLILDPARLDRNIAAAKSVPGLNYGGKHGLDIRRIVGGLDEDLDLQVMRILQGKTTVIPVISKADTITSAHMTFLKKTVWASLKKANFDPLEALSLDDDESVSDSSKFDESEELRADELASKSSVGDVGELSRINSHESSTVSPRQVRLSSGDGADELPLLPMSIISPDVYEPGTLDRKFPWGTANPYNPDHCDFTRLKEAVFSEWRSDLREASREQWYEGWRTSRLKHRSPVNRRR
ncbi:septin [Xylaria nigripes]|nr:septin [Xylaria nigripes]